MRVALALSSVAVLAVFAWLLYLRVQVAKLREESERDPPQPRTRAENSEGSAR
jgi:hypothetical protein